MATEKIKIQLDVDVKKSRTAVRGLKKEIKEVGDASKAASRQGTESFSKVGDSFDSLTTKVQRSQVGLQAWQATAALASTAVLATIAKTLKGLGDLENRRAEQARSLAALIASPGVQSLVDVTGETPLQAIKRTHEQGQAAGLSRLHAQETSFVTRSVLAQTPLKGNLEAAAEVERFANMAARLTGAGPEIGGGLVRGAVAIGAVTPRDISLSIARDVTAARGSATSLGRLGQVLPVLLPEAKRRKIDENFIRSIAASLSLRLPSRQTRTAVKAMMANSTQVTPWLRTLASSKGIDVDTADAQTLIQLQFNAVLDASEKGPAALGEVALNIGLSKGEIGPILGLGGEAFEAGRKQLEAAINAVTPEDLEEQFAERIGGENAPFEAITRARREKEFTEVFVGGQSRKLVTAQLDKATTERTRRQSAGDAASELIEAAGAGGASDRAAVQGEIIGRLRRIKNQAAAPFADRAEQILKDIGPTSVFTIHGRGGARVEQAFEDLLDLEESVARHAEGTRAIGGPSLPGRRLGRGRESNIPDLSPGFGPRSDLSIVNHIAQQFNILDSKDPATMQTKDRGTSPANEASP